ncbi:NUDIX hydrolase [Streptomyces halstedii]|uniref:NUDIX hydrolase n=1 Tax=Streptomyces halstedii TaxID=1944 RepID=UPI00346064EE
MAQLCKTEYQETFEALRYTADVIAVNPDGEVLLIERGWAPYEGMWALPGGHVDPGETSRLAAARELGEETGVHVAPEDLRQIGVWDEAGRDPRGRYITVAYLVVVPEGTQAVAGDDARTARWWPLGALPQLAFDHADIVGMATNYAGDLSSTDMLMVDLDGGRGGPLPDGIV